MPRSEKRRKRENREKMRSQSIVPRGYSRRAVDAVTCAAERMNRGQWKEAREILEEYDATRPGRPEVLELLQDVYLRLNDYRAFCRTCRRLLVLNPQDRQRHLELAESYELNRRPFSALNTFRRFLERWPNDEEIEEVRRRIGRLEGFSEEILPKLGLPPDPGLEIAELNEEAIDCISAGEYERVVSLCDQMLRLRPDFVAAMNNRSQACFELGRFADAVATLRRALEIDGDDIHALANLVKVLFLSGCVAEATASSARLRGIRPERGDAWVKIAEALSLVGDDAGVLEAFAGADQAGITKFNAPENALLYHLAGVASARQGDHRRAMSLWRKALKIDPGFTLAEQNTADSRKRAGEQNGPWPYFLNTWLGHRVFEELLTSRPEDIASEDEHALNRRLDRVIEEHRHVVRLVPALLDRGDQVGRLFALSVAKRVKSPELLEALRAFCQSQRGPDELRMEAAEFLREENFLPDAPLRFWIKGAWVDAELMNFEVYDEPVQDEWKDPQSEELAAEANEALHAGDPQRAERLLNRCLEIEGERPTLLNNLAVAYQRQRRSDEASALLERIYREWPDYFFGKAARAQQAIVDGDIEAARGILMQLRKKSRLHRTEFGALAAAQLSLLLKTGELDGAATWLEMWKRLVPGDANIVHFERRLTVERISGALARGASALGRPLNALRSAGARKKKRR